MLVEEQYLLTQHFCDSSPEGGEDDSAYQCEMTVYKNLDSDQYPEGLPRWGDTWAVFRKQLGNSRVFDIFQKIWRTSVFFVGPLMGLSVNRQIHRTKNVWLIDLRAVCFNQVQGGTTGLFLH